MTHDGEFTLKVNDYKQERYEFFKRMADEAEQKMFYWSSRAKGKSYLSDEVERATRYSMEFGFYTDAANAFKNV